MTSHDAFKAKVKKLQKMCALPEDSQVPREIEKTWLSIQEDLPPVIHRIKETKHQYCAIFQKALRDLLRNTESTGSTFIQDSLRRQMQMDLEKTLNNVHECYDPYLMKNQDLTEAALALRKYSQALKSKSPHYLDYLRCERKT